MLYDVQHRDGSQGPVRIAALADSGEGRLIGSVGDRTATITPLAADRYRVLLTEGSSKSKTTTFAVAATTAAYMFDNWLGLAR